MSRTIKATCGFEIKGEPKKVDFQFKLHQKRCKDCETIEYDKTFFAGNNYKGHVVRSRNGNPVYQPSLINYCNDPNVIGMTIKEYEIKYEKKQLE